MEIIGYVAATLIGLSLGLIGGGGSILTVPVLVYLFGLDAAEATLYSLMVVGTTSLTGVFGAYKRGQLDVRMSLMYAAVSVLVVVITRRLLLPLVPDELFTIGSFAVTKGFATMMLLAVLMLLSAVSMIRKKQTDATLASAPITTRINRQLVGNAALIGLITGLLGAGGGFLLIPALVFVQQLPMKKAVGTSLLIITLNSLIGFAADAAGHTLNWSLLLGITAMAILGIIAGGRLGRKISSAPLQKAFGWFVLVMGCYIIFLEVAK
ncbi:sulfite exporter TauE/SafE family protein [Chitinophaga sp. Cy-1792]|uniref:sulfite exporter TauE/SafE family protein n=1 Tax=Chitinophaga sp. Cy-1792 TaxID=2608339 RepID=UPI001422E4A8|nr:sulfite exporter TauE/SafE family protein [Chitinophaga sp. Cy-1792]NIG54085.1 sulfite exporter TauE/SafE family protein [Chitinophaga sp. Cy-1792]